MDAESSINDQTNVRMNGKITCHVKIVLEKLRVLQAMGKPLIIHYLGNLAICGNYNAFSHHMTVIAGFSLRTGKFAKKI